MNDEIVSRLVAVETKLDILTDRIKEHCGYTKWLITLQTVIMLGGLSMLVRLVW